MKPDSSHSFANLMIGQSLYCDDMEVLLHAQENSLE